MLRINVSFNRPEVPEYDEEIHNPEKVFALLCYRGVYYANGVMLNPFGIIDWKSKESPKTKLTF